jgi:hypothetical protein
MAKKVTESFLNQLLPNFVIEHIGIESKLKDSIEIDSPTKGGALKVYFDSNDMKDAEIRISNAIELRNFMLNKIEELKNKE